MDILKTSLRFFLFMTLLTGGIYPLIVTVIGQLAMADQANGSLIKIEGTIIGSELIGQNFSNPKYFWSRPSAIDYNPLSSGGSNLGLTNKNLQSKVRERSLKYSDDLKNTKIQIPADLLFTSASGLDPHITPEAVKFQIPRIVRERNLSSTEEKKLIKIVDNLTERPDYNLLGENRINVLKLNLAMDKNFRTEEKVNRNSGSVLP